MHLFCFRVQRKKKLEHPLLAYLIKPVQRITKYQLLLKDLQTCCAESQGEIKVSSVLLIDLRVMSIRIIRSIPNSILTSSLFCRSLAYHSKVF